MRNTLRSKGLGCVLLVVLTVMAYLPALRCGFIWDDDDHLTANRAMLSVHGLKQIWSSLAVSRYYPLTLTSFWVQHWLWGFHPQPYHAVNIVLHGINAALLWAVLRRLNVRGAWMAAAVWALHPVNVETVAWITELKNTQSAFFFLLALALFLRFEDGGRPGNYVAAIICGAAAMLSKPSTVVLPGAILLCAWWRRERWSRNDFLRIAPFLAFAVAMSWLTIVEQRQHTQDMGFEGWTLTTGQRLVLAGHAVGFYAGKLFCPTNLCFVYPRWELPVQSVRAWLPLVGLLVAAGILWWFRSSPWARAAALGYGYFLIALLPVVGCFDIFFFRYSFVADHFQYLAGIGLIPLAVSAGDTIAEQAGRPGKNLGAAIALVVLLTLGIATWKQTRVYQSEETLWRDTVEKNPGAWPAHNNLGVVCQESGRLQEAVGHYEAALRINPDFAEAHQNLGVALFRLGRVQEAMGHWEQAIRFRPGYAEAHYSLGSALAAAGRVQEAMGHWELALRFRPDYAEAHYNLGVALEQEGRVQEAIAHYQQALQIRPGDVDAQKRLATLGASPTRPQVVQ